MKIQILTIEGCNKCKHIKQFLREKYLKYTETPCESNKKTCDDVEKLVSCNLYPIVILENEYTGKKELIYTETEFERLRPTVVLSENVTLIPRHSIDGITAWIENRLN